MSGDAPVEPVGVRATSGQRAGRLTWVASGDLNLAAGARVMVRDGADTWLGEVVALPASVYDSPPLGPLPVVERLATPDDRSPASAPTAGSRLLSSLGLSPAFTQPSRG